MTKKENDVSLDEQLRTIRPHLFSSSLEANLLLDMEKWFRENRRVKIHGMSYDYSVRDSTQDPSDKHNLPREKYSCLILYSLK